MYMLEQKYDRRKHIRLLSFVRFVTFDLYHSRG